MVAMKAFVLTVILAMALPAIAKDDRSWLDGHVASLGHTAGTNGHDIPTATVVLYDPGNSLPLARKQVWMITANAYPQAKTIVPLRAGDSFKAYIAGANEYFVIRYLDKKGRVKGESHLIFLALGSHDAP
jgi:hypothetical protein